MRAASAESSSIPSAAETARTVVNLVGFGTLATKQGDNAPLGTFVSYVLDKEGHPVLRLRKDAVHTANLRNDARCSVFVQPPNMPARALARVTLIGKAEPVQAEEAEQFAALHMAQHGPGIGVDAVSSEDEFWRLSVEQVFHVGGLGKGSEAEAIPGDQYVRATPDPLQSVAEQIVADFNRTRADEITRIGASAVGVRMSQIRGAELMWVDRLGCYLTVTTEDAVQGIRVAFTSPALDERDAKSKITLMAQIAWEKEKQYKPELPLMMLNPTDEVSTAASA